MISKMVMGVGGGKCGGGEKTRFLGHMEQISLPIVRTCRPTNKMAPTSDQDAVNKRHGPISVDEIIRKKKEETENQQKIGFIKRDRVKNEASAKVGKSGAVGGLGSRLAKRRGGLSTSSVASSKSVTKSKSAEVKTAEKQEQNQSEEFSLLAKIVPQRDDKPVNAAPIIEKPQEEPATAKDTKTAKRKDQKFVFEWSSKEDTLDSTDPLYSAGATAAKSEAQRRFEHEDRRRRREVEERKRSLLQHLGPSKKNKHEWEDVHWTKKPLDQMRERDWRIFKEDFSILTKGGSIPNPIRSWEESRISPQILNTIRKVGYKEPTPIQRAAIPVALGLRDVIGVAETGSGKTASFVIPLLSYILELPVLNEITKTDGPYGIVLAPTRELAQQIEIETQKFCTPLGFRCASIVGGHSIEEQVYKIQDGTEIVIATPGRLVDCLERRILVLSQCCYVVMDEADRMIDLGFEEQVTKILSALPVTNEKPTGDELETEAEVLQQETTFLGGKHRYRQTMMYTATWPRAIERIAEKYLRRPGIVTIGTAGQATDRVEQRVEFVAGEAKRARRLLDILNHQKFAPPVIIFVNVKRNCDYVAKALNDEGWRTVVMHGSRSQDQREAALSQLRAGTADCLVATDVAGRGIDVPDVSLVVNFQMAKSIEDYTHRIGRTGRAGKSGVAITFLGKEDDDVVFDLKQMISKSAVSKVPDELRRYEPARVRPIAK